MAKPKSAMVKKAYVVHCSVPVFHRRQSVGH